MVNHLLMIAADLENITALQPQGGCDDPNFTYYFKLKCGNCGEVTQKETCVSLNETVPSAKGKGDVHLSQKAEGTKFNDIDLSGGEFAEYDEKGECPVMISNLRAKFDVVK
ncbi:Unknown protein [Striga hermonthica]|uniref:Uncharacterized protein n=1 Tax=Striga hermonthica TaxID=68872 RepID=A0A9N7R1N8_STRHE|nr:Unknown protein [Striga hermonthica]